MTFAFLLAHTASRTAYRASSIAALANASVNRVGLGPLGVALCDAGIARGLLRVDVRAHALDVLIPVALDLVPLPVCLAGSLLRLGTQLGRAIVSLLPRVVDHCFQLRIVLRDRLPDTPISILDLLLEPRKRV